MEEKKRKKTTITDETGKVIALYEYDDFGNITHAIESDGYEVWKEYNSAGKPISYKDNTGESRYIEYNYHGNPSYTKHVMSSGTIVENWYNEDGNKTHYKNSNGSEEYWEYSAYGEVLYHRRNNVETRYDDSGNITYHKDEDGKEMWAEYNNMHDIVHRKYSDGYEEWWKYDYNYEGGTQTSVEYRDSKGYERRAVLDSDNYEIYHKDSEGKERKVEYEFWE